MTNEFGVRLDANGYAPSIVQIFEDRVCFNCEASGDLARHEIFNGYNRKKSKEYGLWVNLCPRCHMQVHDHPDRSLKVAGQIRCMAEYGWTIEEFRERFGKSYVEVWEHEDERL